MVIETLSTNDDVKCCQCNCIALYLAQVPIHIGTHMYGKNNWDLGLLTTVAMRRRVTSANK